MTQAVNLANFANNLDSSGGLNPSALNAATPISRGGTSATTAAAARTALDVPSNSGTGASGNWNIGAVKLATANFTIEEVSSVLYIKFGATVVASITSTGVIKALGDVTGSGTP